MDSAPFLAVLALSLTLVAMAVYFGVRQVGVLRGLRGSQEPPEDYRYARNQAWRRLFGCLLMAVIAAQLLGWFLLGLDDLAKQLVTEGRAAAEAGGQQMTPEQRRAIYACSLYLIFMLVVFLALLFTAGVDAWAIRGYGQRHRRKLQEDRRAMIARQAARLRSQKNGHH